MSGAARMTQAVRFEAPPCPATLGWWVPLAVLASVLALAVALPPHPDLTASEIYAAAD